MPVSDTVVAFPLFLLFSFVSSLFSLQSSISLQQLRRFFSFQRYHFIIVEYHCWLGGGRVSSCIFNIFFSNWKIFLMCVKTNFTIFRGAESKSVIIFQVPPHLRAKIWPSKRGWNWKILIELIFISIPIFLGMTYLNLPLFFISDPSEGYNRAPKTGLNSKFSIEKIISPPFVVQF